MQVVKILKGNYKDFHGLLQGFTHGRGKILILGVKTKTVLIKPSNYKIID